MLSLFPLKVNQFAPPINFTWAPVGNSEVGSLSPGESVDPFKLIWEGFSLNLMRKGLKSLGCSLLLDSEGRRSSRLWCPRQLGWSPLCKLFTCWGRNRRRRQRSKGVSRKIRSRYKIWTHIPLFFWYLVSASCKPCNVCLFVCSFPNCFSGL